MYSGGDCANIDIPQPLVGAGGVVLVPVAVATRAHPRYTNLQYFVSAVALQWSSSKRAFSVLYQTAPVVVRLDCFAAPLQLSPNGSTLLVAGIDDKHVATLHFFNAKSGAALGAPVRFGRMIVSGYGPRFGFGGATMWFGSDSSLFFGMAASSDEGDMWFQEVDALAARRLLGRLGNELRQYVGAARRRSD